jgi:hypothetical protein
MTTQHYFVLTSAQRTTATGLDNTEAGVGIAPRAIDSATPGNGLNLNDQAVGFAVGDPITLLGKYIAPYRMVNDPDCLTYAPDLVTFLLTLPSAVLENETIFLPDTDL